VEDEDVPSEDDEELDSDAAFEDADEERFAGFSFPNVRTLIHFFSYVALSVYEISLAARRRVRTRPIRQKLT
jgi:U3 small nucleolar RNA-associated protein 14